MGTLVGIGDSGDPDEFAGRRFRFEVDEWIKGDLGSPATFDILGGDSTDSCGLALRIGQEAAVFFRVERGRPLSDLCSTIDADAARGYLQPPALVDAPATYLVTPGGGPPGAYLLDRSGRLVAAAPADAGQEQFLWTSALCDDGHTLAEVFSARVRLRDLRTMEVVDDFPHSLDISSVACGADLAVRGVGYIEDEELGAELVGVVDVRSGDVVVSGDWVEAFLAGELLVATAGQGAEARSELRLVDTSTGSDTLLHRAAVREDGTVPHVQTPSASPDRTRISFATVDFGGDTDAQGELFVVEVGSGDLLASDTLGFEPHAVRWLNDNTLAVSSGEATVVLDAASLETLALLGEEGQAVRHQDDTGAFVGLDGPRVITIDGTATTVAVTLPLEHGTLVALPSPLDVDASAGAESLSPVALPIAGVTADQLDATFLGAPDLEPVAAPDLSGTSRSWAGWIAGFAGAILVLGIAATVAYSMRRLRRR